MDLDPAAPQVTNGPVARSGWGLRTHWPLLASALLVSTVWALPIVLGYIGVVDPGAAYRASPAERSSTPFANLSPGDLDTVTLFARILGLGFMAIGVVGLLVTWWPMTQGRTYAIVMALVASLVVLLVAAYFHVNGYWNAWPLLVVTAAWLVGAITASVWLGLHRRDGLAGPRTRRAGRAL